MVRISELEEYAKEYNIPIMMEDGIEFLCDYIKKNNIKRILEIGTAIGYSAIKMASIDKDIKITTIERDKDRYSLALKNISDFKLEEQINVILDDALNVDLSDKYDLIFIDAAKGQYINFFEKFKTNLNNNGVIISDNLSFHGLVESDWSTLTRNVRGLVRKIKNYKDFLDENKEFKTDYYDIGDGIGVSNDTKVLSFFYII